MLRLPEITPVQLAGKEALAKVRKPRGKANTTWLSKVNQDLKKLNINHKLVSEELKRPAEDKQAWKSSVNNKAHS